MATATSKAAAEEGDPAHPASNHHDPSIRDAWDALTVWHGSVGSSTVRKWELKWHAVAQRGGRECFKSFKWHGWPIDHHGESVAPAVDARWPRPPPGPAGRRSTHRHIIFYALERPFLTFSTKWKKNFVEETHSLAFVAIWGLKSNEFERYYELGSYGDSCGSPTPAGQEAPHHFSADLFSISGLNVKSNEKNPKRTLLKTDSATFWSQYETNQLLRKVSIESSWESPPRTKPRLKLTSRVLWMSSIPRQIYNKSPKNKTRTLLKK